MYKIRVESPEILSLEVNKSGELTLQLIRSSSALPFAHIEGVVAHWKEKKEFSRSYRSDKGGFKRKFSVDVGDTIIISMAAHHFSSAVFGQGSSEMDIMINYT